MKFGFVLPTGDARTAAVALVAVSGHYEPDWEVVRPFDAFFRKPIDPRPLVTLIGQFAAARRLVPRSSP